MSDMIIMQNDTNVYMYDGDMGHCSE